jgi:hypothetical protein
MEDVESGEDGNNSRKEDKRRTSMIYARMDGCVGQAYLYLKLGEGEKKG